QVEHSTDRRSDDRNISFPGLLFDLRQHVVTARKQIVDVLLDRFVGDVRHQSVCPGYISTISTPTSDAARLNSSGVPVSRGNGPKCMGMTACGRSSSQA